jgi:hypothetical protein
MRNAKSLFRFYGVLTLSFTLILAAYFSAYFALGYRGTITGTKYNGIAQFYRHNWQVYFFYPAAEIESLFREKPVYIQHWDPMLP